MKNDYYGNISDSEEVIIRDLSPISPIIYTVLETANSVVPECIDIVRTRCTDQIQIPRRVYNWLYPSLMRAIVQVLLHSQNIRTQALFDNDGKIEDSLDWECRILSNNGLAGGFLGYSYRILKALHGELPPPGPSNRKQDYYCQSHLEQTKLQLFPDEETNIQKPNVIYLWDNIGTSKIILSLSCPKWANATRAIPYFTAPIPHPVLTVKPDVKPEDIVEEINLDLLNLQIDITQEDGRAE